MKRIPLTQGKFALVDDEDFAYLNQWKWYASTNNDIEWYAIRNVYKGKTHRLLKMHRVITLAKKGSLVDHRNGQSLDNRRTNLRVCTKSQNNMNHQRLPSHNSSGHMGVSWDKARQKWFAKIAINKKQIALGRFTELAIAVEIRKKAEQKYFKEFASTKL